MTRLSYSAISNIFSGRNIFCLIKLREISPRIKHVPKRQWGEASKPEPKSEAARDPRRGLLSWYMQTVSLSLLFQVIFLFYFIFLRWKHAIYEL
jgi:hypothetical protein